MTEQTTLELARQHLQGATKPTIYADHAAGVCLISELLSLCESLQSDLSRHIEIASEAQTELAQARKDGQAVQELCEVHQGYVLNITATYRPPLRKVCPLCEMQSALDAARKEGQ
jgi:hypothetical protein